MRNIFKDRNPNPIKFVGKVLVVLVTLCIIAALLEVRLNPKIIGEKNKTEINFPH